MILHESFLGPSFPSLASPTLIKLPSIFATHPETTCTYTLIRLPHLTFLINEQTWYIASFLDLRTQILLHFSIVSVGYFLKPTFSHETFFWGTRSFDARGKKKRHRSRIEKTSGGTKDSNSVHHDRKATGKRYNVKSRYGWRYPDWTGCWFES